MKRTTEKRQPKASDYTHSVWSGKKYDRPQTIEELQAESLAVLERHPTIGKAMSPKAMGDWIDSYAAQVAKSN